MVWRFVHLFYFLKKDDVLNLFHSTEFIIAVVILLLYGIKTTELVKERFPESKIIAFLIKLLPIHYS